MNQKGNMGIVVLVGVTLMILVGTGSYFLGLNQATPQSSLPSASPAQTSLPTNTSSPSATTIKNESYTYKKFSLTYPGSWKLSDGEENKQLYKESNIDQFEKVLILEKDNNSLFIGINATSDRAEVGGIFLNEAEFDKFKSTNDELKIGNKTYYLSKNQSSLAELTDPNGETGIYAYASLSEFIPQKVTTDKTYDGYDQLIKNKNGYQYMIIKLSKTGNEITNPDIQKEWIQILESIKW